MAAKVRKKRQLAKLAEYLKHIKDNQIDNSYRNSYQSTVETVKKAAMSRNERTGILYLIVSLPLRFNQISIYAGNGQKQSHAYAMDEVEAEDAQIVQDHRHSYCHEYASPEADP